MCEELWNGFKKKEFEFEGKKAILVFPEKKDEQGNWAIKTEYWGAFVAVEIALLKEGFHLAYLENESRLAPVSDCERKARFVQFLHKEYGLRDKCVPVGMSCGGAHAVNFAGYFPECVQCMFIDAPVLIFCDFPGNESCKDVWEKEFLVTYPGMTRDKLLYFENHPINRVKTLIEKKIPILMMYKYKNSETKISSDAIILKNYIDAHPKENISIKTLSKLIFKSESQTNRIFKKNFSITPYEYILNNKISRAKLILQNSNISIKEISFMLGFSDEHYFSNIFKKKTGISPSAYKKK